MFKKISLFVIFNLLLMGISDSYSSQGSVTVLKDADFNARIAEFRHALVYFYSASCNLCKFIDIVYADAAQQLYHDSPRSNIIKVNVSSKKIAHQFGIASFPVIKWFVNGHETHKFSGSDFTVFDIVGWARKRMDAPVTPLIPTTPVSADTLTKFQLINVVGYFHGSAGPEQYEDVASRHDQVAFFKTTDPLIAEQLGLRKLPSFVLFRNFPEIGVEVVYAPDYAVLTANSTITEQLTLFIQAESLPLIIEYSPTFHKAISHSGIPYQVFIFAEAEILKHGTNLNTIITEMALATRGRLVWGTLCKDSPYALPIVFYYKLDKSKPVQVIGVGTYSGITYSMEDPEFVTVDSLKKFANELLDGVARKRIISAPLPKFPMDEGVTLVVGSTFDAIVRDPQKHVMLLVYSPSCKHSQEMLKTLIELAKSATDIESLIIAKMDGIHNQVPNINVQFLPTLIFFPAGDIAEEGIVYLETKRNASDIMEFINQRASTKLFVRR